MSYGFQGTGFGDTTELLTSIATRLVPCLARTTNTDRAACVWNNLMPVISSMDDGERILGVLASADCTTALNAIGIPAEASGIICGFGADVWRQIQARAYTELVRRWRERGTDRAEGGGRTCVDVDGVVRGVWCDAVPTEVIDASGKVIGHSMSSEGVYPADGPCPGTGTFRIAPEPLSASRLLASARMFPGIPRLSSAALDLMVAQAGRDGALPDSPDDGTAPPTPKTETVWYKSPWAIVGGLAAAGAAIYLIIKKPWR